MNYAQTATKCYEKGERKAQTLASFYSDTHTL